MSDNKSANQTGKNRTQPIHHKILLWMPPSLKMDQFDRFKKGSLMNIVFWMANISGYDQTAYSEE